MTSVARDTSYIVQVKSQTFLDFIFLLQAMKKAWPGYQNSPTTCDTCF